jgi:hypothetical protein
MNKGRTVQTNVIVETLKSETLSLVFNVDQNVDLDNQPLVPLVMLA